MKKKLVLLDVHAILHRAYHALPDFTSREGEPTGALYGVSTMLLKIIEDFKPDYIAACFDLPKPTYRHEVYKEYKAGRAKTDGDLVSQIKRSYEIFKAFNIPIYSHEGFEADDMLGTIVEQMDDGKEVDIIIASGDMDTLQLVSKKNVQVFTLKRGLNDTVVYDEDAVIERFSFGPELMIDYKGLRGDPSDNIPGVKGIGEKTATALITAFGTLENTYKALKKSEESFLAKGFKARTVKLLNEGEEEAFFSKMLATIRRDAPITFKLPEVAWRPGLEVEKVLELFEALDFRTLRARIKSDFGGEEQEKQVEEVVAEEVEPQKLIEAGIRLWLLDSSITSPSLEDMLAYTRAKTFKDADAVLRKEVKEKDLEKVFEIEREIIPAVSSMHDRGILINKKFLEKLSKKHHKTLSALEKKIWKEAGEEFNIKSPKQLGVILFEKLDLKLLRHKKTSTGALSTRESELVKMVEMHAIIPMILEYRELEKLLSTYIDNLPTMLDDDNVLHATFSQTGTTTGRMSSHEPNLQNIPVKSELGRDIRSAFIARKGYTFLACDYSQIELRIAAFLSKDEKLIAIFNSGRDVHSEVASQMFGIPADKVDKEMRRKAKVINFGILYGMGITALQANLKTTRKEAQEFYATYFATFTTLADYIENIKQKVHKEGFTETYFGRRRHFKEVNSSMPHIRAQAERMAVNAPIQGTQSDITKIAMGRVFNEFKDSDVHLLLQIHDELFYEVKTEIVEEVGTRVVEIMEGVIEPQDIEGIECKVNSVTGSNWGEMK